MGALAVPGSAFLAEGFWAGMDFWRGCMGGDGWEMGVEMLKKI